MDSVKQDGYLKIGNKTIDDLIDNKKVDYKMRVYLLTVRMVNGWDKETLEIPVSTYSKRLGIDKRYTRRLLKELKEENLIHRNGSLTSIPGDYATWWWGGKNLPPPGSGKKFTKGGYKVTPETVVKNYPPKHSNTPNKHPRGFYKKLSGKEIEELELDQWYRAIMYNVGKFSIFYIEGTIDDYPYNTRMSCWYKYGEAVNVRDKEAFFSHLLRNYQEDLKE